MSLATEGFSAMISFLLKVDAQTEKSRDGVCDLCRRGLRQHTNRSNEDQNEGPDDKRKPDHEARKDCPC